ncbi:MAG: hypothetical protein PVG92_08175 [Holophagae bacterium]|jgi:hypothetical protein
MKILSSDRSSWIEMERVGDDGFVTYSVAAAIGGFSARHDAITLVGVPQFCAKLAQFDRTRKGEIVLEGGEDFRFVIRSLDASGHLWVGVRIVRYTFLPSPGVADPLRFSGGFDFDPEFATRLFADLRALLE